jgi:hypothetical protein
VVMVLVGMFVLRRWVVPIGSPDGAPAASG